MIKSGIKKVHLFIAKKARHLDELWLIAIFQLRLAARFSWPPDDYADADAAVTCRFSLLAAPFLALCLGRELVRRALW